MIDLAGDAAVHLSVSGIIVGTLLVASGLFVRSSLYDKAVTGRLLNTYSKHFVILHLICRQQHIHSFCFCFSHHVLALWHGGALVC
jgi:hypothetical protein